MAPSFTYEYNTMVFTPSYKLLKHQQNPQNEAVFDLFLDISEIGGKLSKMDVSEIVYVVPPGLRKTQRWHRTFDASGEEAGQL